MNPPAINPKSLMVASKAVAREAQGKYIPLKRFTKVTVTQPALVEGYMLDTNIADAVKLLPTHLQPVVTLMATMVPPFEENRMWEKRGMEALAQATSMSLMVSTLFKFSKWLLTAFVPNKFLTFFFRLL